jgi:Zn-finger nucleic acid-binding protein
MGLFKRKKKPTHRLLVCPRCEQPLSAEPFVTAAERWEIEIDVCKHGCGGLWLDGDDFAADPQADLLNHQRLPFANHPIIQGLTYDEEAPCPLCRQVMETFHWNDTSIKLDRCVPCRGVWFDGAEVQAIQQWRWRNG